MKNIFIKNKKTLIAFVIILIQVIFISVSFGIRKQGYHSDELWNYGFANSSDGMHIFSEDGISLRNYMQWQDSKKLLEYISVDKSEIFDYASIYKNVSKDLNPPLQNMLLHFICSFFPNIWSKWFCFIINILAFIITQIYMYKLLFKATNNYAISLLGISLYGFGIGILNISFFLRIYALGVAFVMMLMYYSYESSVQKDKTKEQNHAILMSSVSCLLGALTVHLYLSIAFIIVFMFCLYFLFTKRIKTMLKYGMSEALSVIISIILFPSAFSHMLNNSDFLEQKKYPTAWQFKIYWSFLTKDISGFHNSALYTMTKHYVFVAIIILIAITLPLCFLFRNENWFKSLISRSKNRVVYLWKSKSDFPYILIILIVSINFFILIDAAHSSIPYMGIYSRRYIFLIYPLYAVLFILLIYYFIKIFNVKNKISNVIILLICLVAIPLTYVYSEDFFSFRHIEAGVTFDDIEKDANCIILFNDIWMLTCATNELYDTNSFYASIYENDDYIQDNYAENIDTTKPLYLLLDVSTFIDPDAMKESNKLIIADESNYDLLGYLNNKDEILEYYENLEISSKLELVGVDKLYDRVFEIYRLN